MKAVFYFNNGKSETLNFLDLLLNERIADVGLEEKGKSPNMACLTIFFLKQEKLYHV